MYEQLSELGLSPAERTAYESLLLQGPQTPPQLAKSTGLSRVNSYAALRGLAKKKLANEKDIKKKKTYFPAPPTRLRELIRAKTEETKANMEILEGLIPNLMNQYTLVSQQPGVSHYEGLEEIKKVYEDTLRPPYPEEILVMRSVYDSKQLNKYIRSYFRKRAKLGVKSRLITPRLYPLEKDRKLLRQRRIITEKIFSLPTQISIYGDRVALISLRRDMMATVIQSKDVAETFRILFELLWAGASEQPSEAI